MKPALKLSLDEDLTGLTRLLWDNRVPHRVVETDEAQILFIDDSIPVEQVQGLYEYWRQGGDLSRVQVQGPAKRPKLPLHLVPVTLGLIVLSLLATFYVGFGDNLPAFAQLTFIGPEHDAATASGALQKLLASGEWWRLVTPIFVHFSVMHLAGNMLWIWIIGQRVEILQGRLVLLAVVIASGVGANLAQFFVSGPAFGGMSGVDYALIGYVWLWDCLKPTRRFNLPPALMGFMLVWLVLGFTGVLNGFGFGSIANTAHLVGLLIGLALCLLVRVLDPQRSIRL